MLKKCMCMMLACVVLFSSIIPHLSSVQASTDYVTAKRSHPSSLILGQEAEVKLNVQGKLPDIVQPNDVVLVIDKSGSMQTDNRMEAAKDAAKRFVDAMNVSHHRVGVVDYSSSSITNKLELNTDKTATKAYIDKLHASGGTQTDYAIEKGIEVLANRRQEARPVMVLLTDGQAQNPQAALEKAKAAREAGIVFYTVALLGKDDDPATNPYNNLLKDMATTAQHHHPVLGSVGLDKVYDLIVQEIGKASAHDVVVTETVSPELEIVPGSYEHNIPKPIVSGNTLTWNFLEMKDEPLNFTYKVRAKQGTPASRVPVASEAKITYKDHTGSKRIFNTEMTYINLVEPPPLITSIVEAQGDIKGGETVTIHGEHFQEGAIVTFDGKSATNIKLESKQKITVTVPSGDYGNAVVTVHNPDKQTANGDYLYTVEPTITKIKPNEGFLPGGNRVEIEGKHIYRDTKVYIGDKEVPIYSTFSNGITVYIPTGDQLGSVDVRLVNLGEKETVLKDGYTYVVTPGPPPPTIKSFSPRESFIEGGGNGYIRGTNFVSGAKVFLNDKEVKVDHFYGPEEMRIKIPAVSEPGKVDIKVVNPDGQESLLKEGLTYIIAPAPEITRVSPKEILREKGGAISISGNNFYPGVKVFLDDQEAKVTYTYSTTDLRVEVPPGKELKSVDVKVVGFNGLSATVDDGFAYVDPAPLPPPLAPEILKADKKEGLLAGGELVYIDGKNFQKGMKVYFGDKEVEVDRYYDGNAKIRVIAPKAEKAGPIDIKIINPDGQEYILKEGYTYVMPPPPPAPELLKADKKEGLLAGGELVYIDGKHFQKGMKVYFGDKEVEVNKYYDGNMKIRVIAPKAEKAGAIDIKIINPDGQESILKEGYTYVVSP